jgi:radical S-adenosyl methionine domain-containing protein 2
MVVNLHLLDACDFRCAHCFAHFGAKKPLSSGQWKTIVDNILEGMKVERFNLAGGEPLLYSGLATLADHIRARGSEVSLITNGYGLSPQRLRLLKERGVSMIGLSIDSANPATLRALGRHTPAGDVLDPLRCLDLSGRIKALGMKLKINTVVSRLNYAEDMNAFIRAASPLRWKILKMKAFRNRLFDNTSLDIGDSQFDAFVFRHRAVPHIAERTMAGAYIMVDAFGNLVDTRSSGNTPAANLLEESFSEAFGRLEFDYGTYNARYAA